jgi:hypothetical protein
MYNEHYRDYRAITIKPTLKDAYNFICERDKRELGDNFNFNLCHLYPWDTYEGTVFEDEDDCDSNREERAILCMSLDKYKDESIINDHRFTSHFIIVPMEMN